MRRIINEQNAFAATILALAAIAPNIFPAAQAGYASMSVLALNLLLPALAVLAGVVVLAAHRGHRILVRRTLVGAAAGVVATIGLEIVRIVSFRLGGMPGDMPRLMGVLLTNRFMVGPSHLSDVLGWAYHFANGGMFGLIFAVLLGRRRLRWSVAYGVMIGIGFLASPVATSLGVGAFGLQMPTMPVTVILAHIVYGTALGLVYRRWSANESRAAR